MILDIKNNHTHDTCCRCGKYKKIFDYGIMFWNKPDSLNEELIYDYFCKECVGDIIRNPSRVVTGCWWKKPQHVIKIMKLRRKNDGG